MTEAIVHPKSGEQTADDEALKKVAFSKVIWRMLPILTLAYVFNFLDRTNIGFAALQMNRDIGLSATQFGWGAGILFVGYCGFEIPGNILLYRHGARVWIARIMISWGLVSCAMALVSGPMSFYILRFILGVAEAGFFPGIAYFLSAWFPAEYRARILSWFLVAIPLSSVLGGPLGGMLLGFDGIWGLAGWKWLFIIEGIPATIIGLVLLKRLTNKPQDATWLTADEKRVIIASVEGEKRDRAVSHFGAALRDVRVWMCTVVYLGFTVGSYGIQIWLPQILKGQNLTNLQVGWISAIPYVAASVGMILWARAADRSGQKDRQPRAMLLPRRGGLPGRDLDRPVRPVAARADRRARRCHGSPGRSSGRSRRGSSPGSPPRAGSPSSTRSAPPAGSSGRRSWAG